MQWVFNDGGRADAGYKGLTGDCGTRAIAIAAEIPYQEVYDLMKEFAKRERPRGRTPRSHPRTGIKPKTLGRILEGLGFEWVACMGIGTGCKVHLHDGELPMGRLVVRVSKHYTAVIDGVIYDTFDPQRETHWIDRYGNISISRRCVYGYWIKQGE